MATGCRQVAKHIKEHIRMTERMGMEYISGRIRIYLKDNSLMIYAMDKES